MSVQVPLFLPGFPARAIPSALEALQIYDPERHALIPINSRSAIGVCALVDLEDAELALGHRWRLASAAREGRAYARAYVRKDNGKRTQIKIHRLLLAPPEDIHVDHVSGNPLDNRRTNLRLATRAQNQANSRKQRIDAGASSRYKGVHLNKQARRWRALIQTQGKQRHLGYFWLEEAAALAYDKAARKLHGEFARVNFPRPGEQPAMRDPEPRTP